MQSLSYQWQQGTDRQVFRWQTSAHQRWLRLNWQGNRARLGLDIRHRFARETAGVDELPLKANMLLSARFGWNWASTCEPMFT